MACEGGRHRQGRLANEQRHRRSGDDAGATARARSQGQRVGDIAFAVLPISGTAMPRVPRAVSP